MNEAIRQVTHVQNIRYDKAEERLYIIDQTLLPNEEKEIELRTVEEMIEAIKMLRIRGAPAIGICAGYCMYALARDIDAKDNEAFYRKLQIDGELLGVARPTAVNLRWAGWVCWRSRTSIPASSPAARSSVWPLSAPCVCTRRSCSLTR